MIFKKFLWPTFLLIMITCVSPVLFLQRDANATEEKIQSDQSLRFSLSPDKEKYRIGDSIKLTLRWKNTGSQSFYFLPWIEGGYTTNWIKAFTTQGKLLQSLPLVEFDLQDVTEKKDWIFLETNKDFSEEIQGKIERKTFSSGSQQLTGIFLTFHDSAIYLGPVNSVNLQAVYENKRKSYFVLNPYPDRGTKEIPLDAWIGKVISNTTRIQVVE